MISNENLKKIFSYILKLNNNEVLEGDEIEQINLYLKYQNGDF